MVEMKVASARFLLGLGRLRARPVHARSAPVPLWAYPPDGAPRATVITIHGANILGPLDPRWVQLNRGLARAGFFVVSPLLASIARLDIHPDQVSLIARTTAAILDAPALCPTGTAGLLSVSFSGGLTLQAAARPALRDRVSAILTIGAFGQLDTTLRFVLGDPNADLYGALLVLRNFIATHQAPRFALRDALHALALDNFFRRPLQMDAQRAKLSKADAAQLTALINDPQTRLAFLADLKERRADTINALDTLNGLTGLRAPVTLVHGRDDDVIPAEESARIAAALEAQQTPARLAITPLLSHGDTDPSIGTLLHQAPALIRAFADWMEEARFNPRRAEPH